MRVYARIMWYYMMSCLCVYKNDMMSLVRHILLRYLVCDDRWCDGNIDDSVFSVDEFVVEFARVIFG